ncbi:MAG: recombinase family protein [Acidobacteriaceae bacterium]|nr:recombinase family protein [Acidobacteriaceae bacterium]MBV9766701.1 recombinase family protein [Acidobacteriaceae bacterium]
MKQYFAYIRVSTTRQGEQGVSLPQQKDAIERYAQRSQLEIGRWFEEQETAAKQGRPVFGTMVRLLRKGSATGVIIHKIDRTPETSVTGPTSANSSTGESRFISPTNPLT